MNPLGVLCARDVMEPVEGTPLSSVAPDATIQEVMTAAQGHDAPVGVMLDGALVAQVTRNGILAKLLDPRG